MAKCSSKQSYSKREVHGDGLLMCSVDQLIWQLSDVVWSDFDLMYSLLFFCYNTTHIRLIMKSTLSYEEVKLRVVTTIFILLMEKECATIFISSQWASLRTYGTYCQYSCGNWRYRSIGSQFILNARHGYFYW